MTERERERFFRRERERFLGENVSVREIFFGEIERERGAW